MNGLPPEPLIAQQMEDLVRRYQCGQAAIIELSELSTEMRTATRLLNLLVNPEDSGHQQAVVQAKSFLANLPWKYGGDWTSGPERER
ncbi:MAG: hypothetical protein OXC11_11035 [Rhodospirillales bacterium]|nr:hypothetical protein [Rhodospirillales bacterium]